MLRRFSRVLYLVKKRNFIDSTRKRFGEFANLRTQTIDSYLMRLTNVRSLPKWLHLRRSANYLLRERLLRRAPSPLDDDEEELVFVDEYSLIENSLAELLNVALQGRAVLIVGDCNQQPAIGEREDQAVRTMLGYEKICFMYDNVRTNDSRLLRRLSCFTARHDGGDHGGRIATALHGLPMQRDVDMRVFFRVIYVRDCGEIVTNYALLPKLIVASNERVNYANWAIGYLVWRNCPVCKKFAAAAAAAADAVVDGGLCCLRYRRSIVFSTTTTTRRGKNVAAAAEGEEEEEEEEEDDAYADEHFVIIGMRYRMIHSRAHWPIQTGSRVIVREIESRDSVIVESDDDRRMRCRLRRVTDIKPYEYGSKWQSRTGADREYTFRMFPFVLDAATTVYQVQGLTLDPSSYPRCYVDAFGMSEKSLYVTLSRFQTEKQIRGVINCHTLD